MNLRDAADIQPAAISGGMLWLFGAAFALTQLTSLALGPAVNRQLQVSLSVPAAELEDAPGSVGPVTDTVLGSVSASLPDTASSARPVAPQQRLAPAASTSPIALTSAVVANSPAVAPASTLIGARHPGRDDNGVERRVGKATPRD